MPRMAQLPWLVQSATKVQKEGVTMPTKDGKVIKVRPEVAERLGYIMEKNNCSCSEAVRMALDGEVKYEPTRQDIMDRAVEREIKAKCKENNISTHDFYRGVLKLWKDGKLGIEGWKVRSLGNYKMERFVELCYILGTTPQKVIDKITKDLEVAYQKWLNQ